MKVQNAYCTVSNYCTDELTRILNVYSNAGYELVSTLMANNEHGIEVMYLFFKKVVKINE